jgi:hypothetical protein
MSYVSVLSRSLLISLLATLAGSCVALAQVLAAPAIPGVKGKLQAVTSGSLDVPSPSGVVHVKVQQPLTTYWESVI